MGWLSQRFELSRGGSASNLRSMEGLRGLAVFLVFLVHYATLVHPWVAGNAFVLSLTDSLHRVGNAGVDLFFVLSGYLIYGSLMRRPQAFLPFMGRRVQRLYPAFAVVFVAYVGLSFVFPAESKIPHGVAEGVLYLIQNLLLLPGLFPIEPVITVAWSLSYEMFYYLIMPGIIAVFGLRRLSAQGRVAFFVAASVILLGACAVLGGPVRLSLFLSGILLYEAVTAKRLWGITGSVAFVALCVGVLANLIPIAGPLGSSIKASVLFVAFFVLCLSCFGDAKGWLSRAFTWTPLRWLGNMSYSYYLIHGLALKAGFLVLSKVWPASAASGPGPFWGLLPVMFALTLLPSALLFLMVERPFSLVRHQASSPRAPERFASPEASAQALSE